jgi:hypothetical protein
MATVFISHEDPRLDYSSAYSFADKLVAVFPPGPGQVTLSPQTALGLVRSKLSGITTDDYLILLGDPMMSALCVAVAAEFTGRIRLLRWNRFTKAYIAIEVDLLERKSENPSPALERTA